MAPSRWFLDAYSYPSSSGDFFALVSPDSIHRLGIGVIYRVAASSAFCLTLSLSLSLSLSLTHTHTHTHTPNLSLPPSSALCSLSPSFPPSSFGR